MQGPDAQRLLAEILERYGSVDAFISQLRRGVERSTMELPRVSAPEIRHRPESAFVPVTSVPSGGGGRHARPD